MREQFDNRVAQVTLAVFGIVMVLIGFGGVVAGDLALAVAFSTFGVFVTLRALRSSSVVVDNDKVQTRSMVRTRTYLFSELRRRGRCGS